MLENLDGMKERIVTYVRENDWVSFPELERVLGEEARGDFQWLMRKFNVIFWAGMSDTFSQALLELVRDNVLALAPAQMLTYLIDGGRLNLPIAKRCRSYKKLHWLPVCLRPFEKVKPSALAAPVRFEKVGS
jgi:hypothetical protein